MAAVALLNPAMRSQSTNRPWLLSLGRFIAGQLITLCCLMAGATVEAQVIKLEKLPSSTSSPAIIGEYDPEGPSQKSIKYRTPATPTSNTLRQSLQKPEADEYIPRSARQSIEEADVEEMSTGRKTRSGKKKSQNYPGAIDSRNGTYCPGIGHNLVICPSGVVVVP